MRQTACHGLRKKCSRGLTAATVIFSLKHLFKKSYIGRPIEINIGGEWVVHSLLEEGAPSGRKTFILATQGKPWVNPGLSFLGHFGPWMGGNGYLTMNKGLPLRKNPEDFHAN